MRAQVKRRRFHLLQDPREKGGSKLLGTRRKTREHVREEGKKGRTGGGQLSKEASQQAIRGSAEAGTAGVAPTSIGRWVSSGNTLSMTMGVEATAVKYTSEGKANSTFKRSSSQNGSAILGVNVCTHNPCKCKHSKFSITIMVPILLSTISYHLKHHLLCSGWDYGAHANVDIFTESDLYWKWHLPTKFSIFAERQLNASLSPCRVPRQG